MNQSKKIIMLISVVCIVLLCVISKEANLKYIVGGIIYGTSGNNSDIIFSRESGFYDDEFELYIFAPTDEIYYTLDGSEPTKESMKYQGSISVADATKNPNKYSLITSVTARFSEELVEEYCDGMTYVDYEIPDYNIDKCNVIRVVYYDENGERSSIEERIYFVGYNEKSGYEDVNIITVTTDPKNLFDEKEGIYVLGEEFENYYHSSEWQEFWAQKYWSHWPANYHERGYDWEREAKISVFDTNKKEVLSEDVGIRVQGGGSRGYLPKSLNIYARETYGEKRLNYDFFGTGFYPKRVTLTSGGDDYYSKIRDRLASELAQDCNIATMHYKPYIVFLNGEYWGFYYLTEKYDVQYIENYYGINPGQDNENIAIIKNGKLEAGKDEDKEAYENMREFISDNDMSEEDNYQKVCEMMDIDSFIDYYAVESYISRTGDWPSGNTALWKSRNVSDQPYEDGKWRWMLFDVNSGSMSSNLIEFDFIKTYRETCKLFNSLCENEEFRYRFSERVLELSETIFDKGNVIDKITEYEQLMNLPMENHFQRFFGTSNELFQSQVQDIKSFFEERGNHIQEIIRSNFGEQYIRGD